MLSVITDEAARSELAMSLDELAREGARRMLAAALEAEVDAYITAFAALTDERGHRLVRRNGHAPARQLATGTGQVEVTRPRVDDRRVDPATGQRRQFQSVILPRWAPGCASSGRPNGRRSSSATCRRWTTCTAGPTGCTSAFAWASRVGCAAW